MIQAMVARPYICGARPRAGITERVPMLNEAGQPIVNNAGGPVTRDVAKYGLHALRHACASLWIERGMNRARHHPDGFRHPRPSFHRQRC